MTQRQFLLGTFTLLCVLGIAGTIGYFSLESKRVDIETKRVEAESAQLIEQERTARTKERWTFLNSMPWVKK
jgi:hypothetical protein